MYRYALFLAAIASNRETNNWICSIMMDDGAELIVPYQARILSVIDLDLLIFGTKCHISSMDKILTLCAILVLLNPLFISVSCEYCENILCKNNNDDYCVRACSEYGCDYEGAKCIEHAKYSFKFSFVDRAGFCMCRPTIASGSYMLQSMLRGYH
uniref:Uncharacterized protein n=1 Tax=Tetranychus urticae TaxID=32264 RepID=T1JT35_TETUR